MSLILKHALTHPNSLVYYNREHVTGVFRNLVQITHEDIPYNIVYTAQR